MWTHFCVGRCPEPGHVSLPANDQVPIQPLAPFFCTPRGRLRSYRAGLLMTLLLANLSFAAAEQTKSLLELATDRFGETVEKGPHKQLNPVDHTLFCKTAAGEEANFIDGQAAPSDPSQAAGWPRDRIIAADRLIWLCTNCRALAQVTHRGIQIKGARIDCEPGKSKIDLKYAQIPFPVVLTDCAITCPLDLEQAAIRALELTGTHVNGILADGLSVTNNLQFDNGFQSAQQVRLIDATVGGEFSLMTAHFLAGPKDDHIALAMDGIKVRGDLILGDDFQSDGFVRFPGACIGGDVNCQKGSFRDFGRDALSMERATIVGDVFLNRQFQSQGRVRLSGASIRGKLDCTGSTFMNDGGKCLVMDGTDVRGGVFFDASTFHGEVDVVGANIGGTLKCAGASFSNIGGQSLVIANADIKGGLNLSPNFVSYGEVRLDGATIRGTVDCGGGKFFNSPNSCLSMDGVDVKGNVFLRQGFESHGIVRLLEARIGQQLDCHEGHFDNCGGQSLQMDGIEVKGLLTLKKCGFRGEVRLTSATVHGTLDCTGAEFLNYGGMAIKANGARVSGSAIFTDGVNIEGIVYMVGISVDGYLRWSKLRSHNKVELDLRSSNLGTLADDELSWPTSGRLHLEGLKYRDISPEPPSDPYQRIKWVRLQPELDQTATPVRFPAQPYSYLAEVLRNHGNEGTSRDVLVQMELDSGGQLSSIWAVPRWLANRLYWLTVGYGYLPWRAAWWVLGFILVGGFFFQSGKKHGLIVPSDKDAIDTATNDLRVGYPVFSPWIYSLEVLTPLLKLGQQDYWTPAAQLGNPYGLWIWRRPTGTWLRRYQWFHIIVGWCLATALVAGLAGMLRTH